MKDKDWKLIDRFLKNDMSEQEVITFNKRLKQEEDLQHALKFELNLQNTQRQAQRDRIRESANNRNTREVSNGFWAFFILILILLTFFGAYYFLQKDKVVIEPEESIRQLRIPIAQNKDIFDGVLGAKDDWKDAYQLAVENKDDTERWQQAIIALELSMATDEDLCRPIFSVYLRGLVALYYEKKYAKAQSLLSCLNEEEPKYFEQAQQHIVMVSLLQENYREAAMLLDSFGLSIQELPLEDTSFIEQKIKGQTE